MSPTHRELLQRVHRFEAEHCPTPATAALGFGPDGILRSVGLTRDQVERMTADGKPEIRRAPCGRAIPGDLEHSVLMAARQLGRQFTVQDLPPLSSRNCLNGTLRRLYQRGLLRLVRYVGSLPVYTAR